MKYSQNKFFALYTPRIRSFCLNFGSECFISQECFISILKS